MGLRYVWEKWNVIEGVVLGSETNKYTMSLGGSGSGSEYGRHAVAIISDDVRIDSSDLEFVSSQWIYVSMMEPGTIPANKYAGFSNPVMYTLGTVTAKITEFREDSLGYWDLIYDVEWTGRMKLVAVSNIKGSTSYGNTLGGLV